MLKTNNRWVVIIWHTLLAIVMMQACRLLFYYFNRNLFDEIGVHQMLRIMRGGYVLDMKAIAYGFAPYYFLMVLGAFIPLKIEMNKWYRTVRHLSYFGPFSLFLFLNISDIGYYPFVLRRVNSDVFKEFESKSFVMLYKDFIVENWELTLTFVILLILGILAYRVITFKRRDDKSWPLWVNLPLAIVLSGFLYFSLKGRGDLSLKKLNVMERVTPLLSSYEQFPIMLNTPIALSMDATGRKEFSFFKDNELSQVFTPYYVAKPLCENDSLFGAMKGRNVMIILLESMASEYIGFYNREQKDHISRTPFLDSLLPQTLYAKYSFATGKRSVESFPSIFVSLPSFGGTYNDSDWNMSNYKHVSSFDTGIPTALAGQNYQLKFYHGDNNGAMGFFPFLNRLGVNDQYTAQNYIAEHGEKKSDKVETWGIHDLPFEQAMAEDMNKLKEPFGAFFFSLSNHYPYKLPSDFENTYKEGSLLIHKTTEYADYALSKFFEKAKQEPWFENTLFVITADHTNLSDHPAYNNLAGHAAAPIAFYDPQGKLKGEIKDYVVQHTDILPTLLYLLGIEEPVLSYGSNIFDTKAEHIALNYFQGQYIFFTKEITLTMTPTGDIKASAPVPYLQTEPDKAACPLVRYKSTIHAFSKPSSKTTTIESSRPPSPSKTSFPHPPKRNNWLYKEEGGGDLSHLHLLVYTAYCIR